MMFYSYIWQDIVDAASSTTWKEILSLRQTLAPLKVPLSKGQLVTRDDIWWHPQKLNLFQDDDIHQQKRKAAI